MEFFPSTLDRGASDALVDRFEDEFARLGFCPWALEVEATSQFIGFVGLHAVAPEMPFTPAIEVGWRLARRSWGIGYATEAATRAIAFGFDELGLDEIVSFTAIPNIRSRRVMERLGMRRDERGEFDHPKLPDDERLRRHVLYHLKAADRRSDDGTNG